MTKNIIRKDIIQQTENYIRKQFENERSGHDWWHIHRVRNLALYISENEGGNQFIIEMAALLHDLDDWKINTDYGSDKTITWLQHTGLSENEIEIILDIIEQVSFKGAGVEMNAISIEAKIVQDADRLDAIGAVGIARTFAFGGNRGRIIYNPLVKPKRYNDFDAYKNNDGPTINHFYEKLLLLNDLMNTTTAKKLAEHRHRFMELYLKEFFNEWDFALDKI